MYFLKVHAIDTCPQYFSSATCNRENTWKILWAFKTCAIYTYIVKMWYRLDDTLNERTPRQISKTNSTINRGAGMNSELLGAQAKTF